MGTSQILNAFQAEPEQVSYISNRPVYTTTSNTDIGGVKSTLNDTRYPSNQ